MTYLNAFPLIQSTDWDFEDPRDNFGGFEGVNVRRQVNGSY